MARTIERRSGKKDGEKPVLVGETIHEYFAPEKSMIQVRRGELASVLLRFQEAQRARRWHRRGWTWLKRRIRPAVDMIDFLRVLRREDEATRALAQDAGQEAKPL